MSGGLKGEISQALHADDGEKLKRWCVSIDIFAKKIFLSCHHPEMDEQRARNADMTTLSKTGAACGDTRCALFII